MLYQCQVVYVMSHPKIATCSNSFEKTEHLHASNEHTQVILAELSTLSNERQAQLTIIRAKKACSSSAMQRLTTLSGNTCAVAELRTCNTVPQVQPPQPAWL